MVWRKARTKSFAISTLALLPSSRPQNYADALTGEKPSATVDDDR